MSDSTPLRSIARLGARTALYTTLAAWGAVTILRNVDRGTNVLRKVTRFGMVAPNYRFFGPLPATHDQKVVVRHRDEHGALSPWQGLHVGPPRRALHTVWAPFRRADKAFTDALFELRRIGATANNVESLPSTTAYRMILNVVRHRIPHDPAARQVQFAVCQTADHEPAVIPRIVYVSQFHDLTTGEPVAVPVTA